jgi:hypothetical protein
MMHIVKLIVVSLLAAATGVAIGALFALPITWLWNNLIPDIFGLKQITWLQAWGLNILADLLVKSGSVSSK